MHGADIILHQNNYYHYTHNNYVRLPPQVCTQYTPEHTREMCSPGKAFHFLFGYNHSVRILFPAISIGESSIKGKD